MSSLLLVFGKNSCPYTINAVQKLIDNTVPFLYRAKEEQQTLDDLIAPVADLTQKRSYPVMVLLEKKKDGSYHSFRWDEPDSSESMVKQAITRRPIGGPCKITILRRVFVCTSNGDKAQKMFAKISIFLFLSCVKKKTRFTRKKRKNFLLPWLAAAMKTSMCDT